MSSLIEMILGQKIILLSLGAAVLIFLAAITLALVGALKRRRANRPKRKLEAVEATDEVQAAAPTVRTPAPAGSQPAAAQAPPAASPAASPAAPTAAAAAPGSGLAAKLATKPAVPAAQPAAQAESTSETQTDPAMKDLLSSVFSNEESAARYAVLLEGLGNVEIAQLTTLCRQVSDQLQGER
ncbi:MAG: hypothetical protein HZC41_25990 [Chloroflexi bacterium]|nr:hypothetical protein [Chloroflexota bacterium]